MKKYFHQKMESFIAFMITRIPGCGDLTLGFNRISSWYQSNKVYKFSVGTKISLKNRRYVGYGVRPEGIVKGYTEDGSYIIEMTKDKNGNYFEWIKNKILPLCERITNEEIHFKWNIEYHFRKVTA